MNGKLREHLPKATAAALMLAGVLFPFSVAATNAALAVALIFGFISGEWWEGARWLLARQRVLVALFLAYAGWAALSLLWSLDVRQGMRDLSHWWFFLLLPLLVGLHASWRTQLIWGLSLGLFLHLCFTLLQAMGWVEVSVLASTSDNPTGHIGHIGFGVVYGMWIAWLVHRALLSRGKVRLAYALFATWSVIAVFMAQGRSGYLVTALLLLAVIWRHVRLGKVRSGWKLLAGGLALVLALVLVGPGKARLAETWEHFLHPATQEAKIRDARLSIWQTAVGVWRLQPWLGVGSGGYWPGAQKVVQKHPELAYGKSRLVYDHPHNLYLLALAEWGPVGLIIVVGLLAYWIVLGWRMDWHRGNAGCWIASSGLAMAVHGMSSLSLNEHFTGVLAILLLGFGLLELRRPTA